MKKYEMMGLKLREKRLELGLTQEELAKRCGYKSRTSINKLELSRVIPTNKIEAICNALDITPYQLFGWGDVEPSISKEIIVDENGTFTYSTLLSEKEMELISIIRGMKSDKTDLIIEIVKSMKQ